LNRAKRSEEKCSHHSSMCGYIFHSIHPAVCDKYIQSYLSIKKNVNILKKKFKKKKKTPGWAELSGKN
jgi:hypothetical protein